MVRRQILITLTLALLGCPFLSGAALAQTALRPLPPALATLSDETGSLSPSQARALLKKLSQIEDRTTVKIIVLIAATVHPETIEAYVQRVIDRWKNSNSKLGSDRFIFVAIAKQDRAIRVVPGQQLSWVLEPFMTSGIMGETSLLLKRGDYYEALVAIGNELLQLIESNKGRLAPSTPVPKTPQAIVLPNRQLRVPPHGLSVRPNPPEKSALAHFVEHLTSGYEHSEREQRWLALADFWRDKWMR